VQVALPTSDFPIVFSEVAGDLAKQLGGAAIIDPEILFNDNLVELKHHKLTRVRKRDYKARDLKPNPTTRDALAALTARPPTEPISIDEKDLIWRFRFYLSKNKKALTKFLRCIAWDEPAEAKQAVELLDQWDKIDVDDALELLGKTFTARAVRSYAVERLNSADADELCLCVALLQLMASLSHPPHIECSLACVFLWIPSLDICSSWCRHSSTNRWSLATVGKRWRP
jgi:phosphatidylinositol 3-kinase